MIRLIFPLMIVVIIIVVIKLRRNPDAIRDAIAFFSSKQQYKASGVSTSFCTECGSELPDKAGFCPNCGKSMEPEAVQEKPSQSMGDMDTGVTIGSYSLTTGWLLCFGLQVFALVVYCVFPLLGYYTSGSGRFSAQFVSGSKGQIGMFHSDTGSSATTFLAFLFIAFFVFFIIRGLLNRRKVISSILIQLAAVLVYSLMYRSVIAQSSGSYIIKLRWGFIVTIICLIISMIAGLTADKN